MERLNFDAIILKPNDNVGTSIKTLKNLGLKSNEINKLIRSGVIFVD